MNYPAIFKRITLLSTVSCLVSFPSFAQQEEEPLKIVIRKTEIINGDTTTEEKTLTGKEAEDYKRRSEYMHHSGKGHGRHAMVIDRDRIHEMKDHPDGPHHVKKIIIRQNADGEEEIIEKTYNYEYSDDDRRVVIESDMDDAEGGIHKIEVIDDKVIIYDADGKEKVIELEGKSDKADGSDKKVKRMIIINEVEVTDDGNRAKTTGASATGGVAKTMVIDDDGMMNLKFYPNPNDGNFTLETKLKGKENATIEITDVNGKKIYEDTIKDGGVHKKQIDLRSHGKGVYFVTVKQQNDVLSKKVVVE